jgi:hypothetical protein
MLAALLLAGAAGCDERESPAPARPAAVAPAPVVPPPAPPAPPAPTSRWDAEAGLALVVPGAEGEAMLVVPGSGDSTAVADTVAGAATAVLPAPVTLYGRAGLAGEARATLIADAGSGACTSWPRVRLGLAAGAGVLPGWTVGVVQRREGAVPSPLALDSLEGLHGTDSALVTAAVTRLAAALPSTQRRAAGRFHGLPFLVRSARRFTPVPGREAIVAVLGRALAQESAPQAEEVVLVAERPAGGEWAVGHAERVSGPEETLPAIEVLGAFRIGAGSDGRAVLVLARELDRGSRYTLLEREGPVRWAVRWTSVRRGGC